MNAEIVHMSNRSYDKQKVHVIRLKFWFVHEQDQQLAEDTPKGEFEINTIEDQRMSQRHPGHLEYLVLKKGHTLRRAEWVLGSDMRAPELLATWRLLKGEPALPATPLPPTTTTSTKQARKKKSPVAPTSTPAALLKSTTTKSVQVNRVSFSFISSLIMDCYVRRVIITQNCQC